MYLHTYMYICIYICIYAQIPLRMDCLLPQAPSKKACHGLVRSDQILVRSVAKSLNRSILEVEKLYAPRSGAGDVFHLFMTGNLRCITEM